MALAADTQLPPDSNWKSLLSTLKKKKTSEFPSKQQSRTDNIKDTPKERKVQPLDKRSPKRIDSQVVKLRDAAIHKKNINSSSTSKKNKHENSHITKKPVDDASGKKKNEKRYLTTNERHSSPIRQGKLAKQSFVSTNTIDAKSNKPQDKNLRQLNSIKAIQTESNTAMIEKQVKESEKSTTLNDEILMGLRIANSLNSVNRLWFKEELDEQSLSLLYKEETKSRINVKSDQMTAAPTAVTPLAGKYVAIDCEMVGVANGESVLARVSIVNYDGEVLYDTYVKSIVKIVDFRTAISGVSSRHLKNAKMLSGVQKEVSALLDGRVVIGHHLEHDFKALMLPLPSRRYIRDTSSCPRLHQRLALQSARRRPGLKQLAKELLGMDIQQGAHSSVDDAKATMMIYRKYREDWETLKNNPVKRKV